MRGLGRRVRRVVAVVLAPVTAAGTSLVPVVFTVAAVAGVSAASAAVSAAPAQASAGTVLVVLQNGETTAPETAIATAAGFTVTQVTPSTWDGMTAAQFKTYSALVIGDPSSGGTCSTLTPTTGTSGSDALGTTWQSAVTGKVAVLGTAPALAGSSGATSLVSNAISYAATQPSSGSVTGLYESLNCEFATSAAGTAVPLLNGIEGASTTAGGLAVTGQGSTCVAGNAAGTVNKLAAEEAPPFGSLDPSALGSAQWASPACAVRETFSSWPANYSPVAYDASSSATGTADFTASDGVTGQPYVLLGGPAPTAATQALAPTEGGEVPEATTAAGTNAAAPGVQQATAGDPVNTENGDFTQTGTDLSVPGFGPALDFSRTYDSTTAAEQTQAGAPGPMGYGWTDNLATSLTTGQPTLGDIYALDGLGTDTGNGGLAASGALNDPISTYQNGGNVYIPDALGNRIEEVAGASGTQWGISMTAGHVYTIVGSDTGAVGDSANGTPIATSLLDQPGGVTMDSAGNLYIADSVNNRILEVPVTGGMQRGIPMIADDVYTIAGSGVAGPAGDGGLATLAQLNQPQVIVTDGTGANPALEIADSGNNRIQYIFETGGTAWDGVAHTANDIYTIAGSSAGTAGSGGNNSTANGGAFLNIPTGLCRSSTGDLYISDEQNDQIREVPAANETAWGGQAMTASRLYTVAGVAGASANATNGTAAGSADLNLPFGIACPGSGTSLSLYITEFVGDEIQEIPSAAVPSGAWGVASMAADKIYTVAGSTLGHDGSTGNGGVATSALLERPEGAVSFDSSGNMYISDTSNNEIREVSATTFDISQFAGNGTFQQEGDGGPSTTAALENPSDVAFDTSGDLFISDSSNNRVQEIPAHSRIQFGIAMTAGDVYTVAGSPAGFGGDSGDGGPATTALLASPEALVVDPSGNLFISDGNGVIRKVAASTGIITQFAGQEGIFGVTGNGGPASSAEFMEAKGLAADANGDIYISDYQADQLREVAAVSGVQWGQNMTAGDIYLIAGDPSGIVDFFSGDGGPASAATLNFPSGLTVSPAGDVYIADSMDNRIREIAVHTGPQWGKQMTAGDIYTVAGSSSTPNTGGNGGRATSAKLNEPGAVALDRAGDLYIADSGSSQIREVAATNGTQWHQTMTATDIYLIAGSSAVTQGETGNGAPATSALLDGPAGLAVDNLGDVYLADTSGTQVRVIPATTFTPFSLAPAANAVDITQPDGSKITFYPQTAGACTAPFVVAGQYCTLPENISATLSFSSANGGTYTYSPSPGSSYIYGSSGALESETDAAGDTLTVSYGALVPGAGNCPATANTCDSVTAASGRALTIGHNAGGMVTSVTDPLGRRWTYAYTGSDLTSATDPMGNVTSYTYGSGATAVASLANDLLTITSPNAQPGGPDAGDATANVYNGFGQVITQTDPMGFQTTFNYCISAVTGNCLNTATGTGVVTINDPDGNKTVNDYQQGTLAAQSVFSGSTLASETDNVPSTAAGGSSGGTLLDALTVDGDGNITTTAYNAAGLATSIVAPDGVGNQSAIATMAATSLNAPNCESVAGAASTCPASAGPAPVAAGGVINPPSSVPPQGMTWTLYDSDGNELYDTTGIYQPGATTASSVQTTYQLFKGNSVTLSGSTITCAVTPPGPSLPCATINGDGVVTQLAYDSAGNLTSSATPDGNGSEVATTTYAYDADGEQTSTTVPDGNLPGANTGNYTTVTAYNANGKQTSVTVGSGSGITVTPRVTTDGYDSDGNQAVAKDARGFTTTTSYNADDKADLVTDPAGNATLSCYDGAGNTTQTVPAVGVAANSLTPASCPSSYPSGYGHRLAADATTFTIDAAGNQTVMTTPAPAGQTGSETTTTSYDGNGNITSTTAPPASNASGAPNQVTSYAYNSAGEIAAQTVGAGTSAASTTSYCFDPSGDQTSVVAPDGNTSATAACETSAPWVVSPSSFPAQASYQTTSRYDSLRELVSTTSPATSAAPGGATTNYTHDLAGNRLTSTDPNGVTTTWTFTPGNLPATISYSGSSAHSVSNTYDADGAKTAMTDASGSSSYTYNPFGEITAATNGSGQVSGYGYDPDGNTSSITYPLPLSATWAASDTVSFGYTNADTLSSVTDFSGNQIAVTDNADGDPAAETLGSTGDTISTNYDNADNPEAIALSNSSATLQRFTYADAPSGGILTETDVPSSPSSPATYGYDARGRVTSMTPGSAAALSYGFDASGDLTTLPTGATGTYDHAGQLTSSALSGSTINYAYDADGQRMSSVQGSTTITSGAWNGAGQLTTYAGATASMSGAAYDGDGLRASASFTPAGGSAASQGYLWGNDGSLLMDSSRAYIYAGSGAPAEQVDLATGTATFLVTDSLGSVRGTVNSAGALTGTTSYDAWGNPQAAGGLTVSPFGFAGGYTDPDGIVYLIHRYYDPQTGQFTSADPELSQTLQPYGYASGNPVSQTDPSGQSTIVPPPANYFSPGYVHARSVTVSKTHSMLGSNAFRVIWGEERAGLPTIALDTFAAYVRPGGPWDMKIYLPGGYSRVSKTIQIYYNVWGNISYSYVGRSIGFRPGILQNGGEVAGLPFGTNTSGNYIERQMGLDLFTTDGRLGAKGFNNGTVDQAIHDGLSRLSHYCDAIKYGLKSCPRGEVW
jgi:RHS repeat-associated protein